MGMKSMLRRQQRLLEIIDLIYDREDADQMLTSLFTGLRELFAFSSGVLLPIEPETFELQEAFCFDCPPENNAPYLQHYAAFDPYARRDPGTLLLNQTVRLSEVASAEELDRSEFADFMPKVPYHHALAAVVGVDGEPLAAISVHRCKGKKDFDRDEMAMLDRIAPHLGRAIAWRRREANPATLAKIGLLAFGACGQLLFMNTVAQRLIPQEDAAAVLGALPPAGSGSLLLGCQRYRVNRLPWRAASMLTRFALQEAGDGLGEGNGQAGAATDHWAAAQRLGARLTIISLEPFRRREDVRRRLSHYGLSPRELEITAQSLLSGLTNAQLAQRLSISEDTVKSHLREAYRKIGVSSRMELLVNLLGLDSQ
jgi:DNA-binding CsgD family transcriptional regulator